MAIKEIKREWSPCQLDYVKTYLLHSESDVKDLPKCCVGSKATVSETDNEYVCTEDGWKLGSELGGGEVVILPETEMTRIEVNGNVGFTGNPTLMANPEAGKTYAVTVNGTQYDIVAELVETGIGFVHPDEMFGIIIFNSEAAGEVGFSLGVEWYSEDAPDSVTLSIVEVAKTGSAGGGGGVLMVNGTTGTPEVSEDGTVVSSCTFDKTYAEIVAALNAGQYVVYKTEGDDGEFILPIIMTEANAVTFGIYVAGKSIAAMLDSTDNGMLYVMQPSA